MYIYHCPFRSQIWCVVCFNYPFRTPRNYGFLKRIISADDVVSDAFRWHTRQNEGVTGTYSVISWSTNFYWWILLVQSGSAGERYFSAVWNLKTWLRSTMTQERTAKFVPPRPAPQFKTGGHRPPRFKNCSAGPVIPLNFGPQLPPELAFQTSQIQTVG